MKLMNAAIAAEPQIVKDYWRLFVNRRAYTLQSMRPSPESGRHYYYQPKEKGTTLPRRLSENTIRMHLEGRLTVGLYAISPVNQRCKWIAIDADYKNAMGDLLKLRYHLTQDGVDSALEMSRRGGHLWVFLATPLLARECRIYIYHHAFRLGIPVKGSGQTEGIEIFPKHDTIGVGEYGNAIRAPLGIHRGANRRFWFYGADYTLESQITYLNNLRKLTEKELRAFVAGIEVPAPLVSARSTRPVPVEGRHGPRGTEFQILEHVGIVRKVGGTMLPVAHPVRNAVTTGAATTSPS